MGGLREFKGFFLPFCKKFVNAVYISFKVPKKKKIKVKFGKSKVKKGAK